jgi:hypothetical protein
MGTAKHFVQIKEFQDRREDITDNKRSSHPTNFKVKVVQLSLCLIKYRGMKV